MAANGISTLSTKQAKQLAKLNLAAAKRSGSTITFNTRIYQSNVTTLSSLTVDKTYGDLNGIIPQVGWTITNYGPITNVTDSGVYWTLQFSGTAFSGGANLAIAIVKPAPAGGTRARANFDISELPTQYSNNAVVKNTNSSGLVAGRPWVSGPVYTAGVYRTQFRNYNTNSADLTVFSTPANIVSNSGTVATDFTTSTSTTNLGYEWVGYFKADYTGTWTFNTGGLNVDDAFSVWIGPNAVTGYTAGNAVFSVSLTQGSGTVNLTAGTYYPIRVQFGNNAGPGSAGLYYSHTGQGASANYTGKLFYNPATNGF